MQETLISWSNKTWNPTFGCSKISAGCTFCYAETIALKFGHSKLKWTIPNEGANVVLKPHKLREPYALKEPSRIFVNSMSDVFHEQIPDDYISRIFEVMNDLPQHQFQVLTKRPERAAKWAGPWGPNIWMGTTVEDNRVRDRVDILRGCGAAVRFLSVEPMIGPIPDLDLSGIHWVICGGESGPHLSDARYADRWMDHAWARGIRDSCLDQDVRFFFKQSSAIRTEQGCSLQHEDGSFWKWEQFPDEPEAAPPTRAEPHRFTAPPGRRQAALLNVA